MESKIGFRIYKDFKRPSEELVHKFNGIPSSNIGDILLRLSCMRHEIKPFNDLPLLGIAFTVKAPAGDNLVLQKALDLAKPGDIIVVDGEGCKDRSLMGEMMVDYAVRRGIKGFVIDGAVRDANALKNAKIPFYASAVTPQGPYKNGPGEINVPIACGGQVVFPGDILVGDEDGIVVIRPQYAEELAELAIRKHDGEITELASRTKGNSIDEMIAAHIGMYDPILEKKGVQYLEFAECDGWEEKHE